MGSQSKLRAATPLSSVAITIHFGLNASSGQLQQVQRQATGLFALDILRIEAWAHLPLGNVGRGESVLAEESGIGGHRLHDLANGNMLRAAALPLPLDRGGRRKKEARVDSKRERTKRILQRKIRENEEKRPLFRKQRKKALQGGMRKKKVTDS